MIQNCIKTFNDDNEINDEVACISQCKYCKVTDIRILSYGTRIRAQIVYNYDIEAYAKDHENTK